jgi:hypothetical protein
MAACNYNASAGCNDGSCTYPQTWYMDADNDGYGNPSMPVTGCVQPPQTVADNTDCDDSLAQVYPGAPGTGEGLDNNCSGVLDDGEHLGCAGDFDNSGQINTADLLIFLANYGCMSNCSCDLTGDDIVGTSDLLFFLGVFGTFCNN